MALLPGDSQRFWGGLFLDSQRVGGCCVPANQSLRGAILGIDPSFGSAPLLGVALIIGIIGVTVAVLAGRRGDEAMGFSRCAITGLLVSPVSWTHHWTLAVPALLLLGVRVFQSRTKVGMLAVAATLLVGYSYLPKLMSKPVLSPGSGPAVGWTVAAGCYVLIGLVAIAVACVQESRALKAAHALTRRAPSRRAPDEALAGDFSPVAQFLERRRAPVLPAPARVLDLD
jgi:alpha-1,2-mannosyltransferase